MRPILRGTDIHAEQYILIICRQMCVVCVAHLQLWDTPFGLEMVDVFFR